MASNTDIRLRNAVIYSIYIRNHTKEGTFRAAEADLPRIRDLGADIVWLMPIHPIGVLGRKGSLGCPYANRDYRTVNPEYGTLEDFIHFVDTVHSLGMKCMIDVVYNHTSKDSALCHEHPEFFYHDANGAFGNRFGDWSDVNDLDYSDPALWDYQIESLRYWAQWVDGFRCDVASLVPLEFWKKARAAVAEVRPGCIWLAESVHASFNREARRQGLPASTDPEAYAAFDLEYDYDIREALDNYWAGTGCLSTYISLLSYQEAVYPGNYIKLRCLENHDQPRIASRFHDPAVLRNWNAFLFFQKGTTLLYGGEERCDANQPSLFEKDLVHWDGPDISDELRRLIQMKKAYFPADGWFHAEADDSTGIVTATFGGKNTELVGVFGLEGKTGEAAVSAEDGSYENLIDGNPVSVRNGKLRFDGEPVILKRRTQP